MPSLYLTETDSTLRLDGDCFKINSPDGTTTSIPIMKVDAVTIFGNTQITTQAIAELLERDIPTTFLSSHGKYYGRLVSTETKSIELRLAQIKKIDDLQFRLDFAREAIKGKILNAVYLLKNLNRYKEFEQAKVAIDKMLTIIPNLAKTEMLDSLRGHEGSAAAHFFRAFPCLLKESFGFSERNRRPPKDPVNSMLSFTYTLLLYQVYSAVVSVGLDPAVGFLHEYQNNRPALPLDLMEEFRALLADQVVVDLINHSMVHHSDFYIGEDADRPVLMNNDIRKKLITRFEKRLATVVTWQGDRVSYRRMLELQARALVRNIRTREPYKAFIQQ